MLTLSKREIPSHLLRFFRPRRTIKPRDDMALPAMLGQALRDDGWWLRSEIVWARPNPMPESVSNRPTKSHSTVFLLSKRPRYFMDMDAIREAYSPASLNGGTMNVGARNKLPPGSGLPGAQSGQSYDKPRPRVLPQSETLDGSLGEAPRGPDGRRATRVTGQDNSEQHRDGERWPNPSGANSRSVWTIPTQPTSFQHFASWPEALVRRMILAGTSERGCCPECGAPWVRQIDRPKPPSDVYTNRSAPTDGFVRGGSTVDGEIRQHGRKLMAWLRENPATTVGWSPSCAHDHEPIPAVILDCFAGSGTTSLVARNHGRHSIGIELNSSYLEIAAQRLQQLSLLTSAPAEDGGSHRSEMETSDAN